MKPLFQLVSESRPSAPVDGYEIRVFLVNRAQFRVDMVRYVYHVNKTWMEVCSDDTWRLGESFLHQWQILYNDQFTGRIDGWRGHDRAGNEPAYSTAEEARCALFEFVKSSIRFTEEKLAELCAIRERMECEGVSP